VPENERIQQRKNLIDRRQDKSDDSKLPQILKVPVESSHLSEVAVPRTMLDDLFREPLLNRRFQAQDKAAAWPPTTPAVSPGWRRPEQLLRP
jgi:hypothetical protein